MTKVAIVEKYPSTYDYNAVFPFSFDKHALVSERKDKILKRDVTLDIEEVKEYYDYIILVGKEPCKLVADIRSVTEYQGFLVEKKYLAMLNPIAVKLNPSQKGAFEKSINDIILSIEGKGQIASNFESIIINTEDTARKYLQNILELAIEGILPCIALDTETTALYPRDGYILGISISYQEGVGAYIDALAMSDENIKVLQEIIKLVYVIFHNMKFDRHMLEYHFNLKFYNVHDTMLEHYCLDEVPGTHGLKTLCLKHTDLGNYDKGLEDYKAQYCKNHKVKVGEFTYDLFPFEVLAEYAAFDAGGTFKLHNKFYPLIQKNPKLLNLYNNILIKGSNFLQKVEDNGIPISLETLEAQRTEINLSLEQLTHDLYQFEEVKEVERIKKALFNVNSTQHVGCLFFEVLKLPVTKLTDGGKPSADASVLEDLAEQHKVASVINQIKKLKKIKSTYLDKIASGVDSDSRLRTNYNLHMTTSGRLSSSGKLNAQQLPRDNKAPKLCMEARKGFKIVSQDLKTAEMYVASVLSGDKVLQQIFINGEDYHGSMAVQKFNLPCTANEVAEFYPAERQGAKTISFEILYKLNYREPALKNFKQLKKWLQDQEKYIKANGFIYSFFGRKRRLADVFSPNREESQHQVRSGINFLVQSVSSDINLLAGIEMQEWIEANGYKKVMIIWGLVHDSILAEVHDEYIDLYKEKLAYFTQRERGLSIPGCPIGLDVEIGQSYGSVKPI